MTAHASSLRTYLAVFLALLGLTALTVGVSYFELGPFHLTVGLLIAMTKMTLVALFFMHLWHGGKLTWLVVLASGFLFAVLVTITLSDYLTRNWTGIPGK
jgi:cytochrome c oxidase subunit 4